MNLQSRYWLSVYVDLRTLQRLFHLLKSEAERIRMGLPEGVFHGETGEPLDAAADLRARFDLLDEEHFRDLDNRLAEAVSRLESEKPTSMERPVKEVPGE